MIFTLIPVRLFALLFIFIVAFGFMPLSLEAGHLPEEKLGEVQQLFEDVEDQIKADGLKVPEEFKELKALFEDAADHVQDDDFRAAQDILDTAAFLRELHAHAEGRTRRLLANTAQSMDRLARSISHQNPREEREVATAYRQAILAVSTYIRDKAKGKLKNGVS